MTPAPGIGNVEFIGAIAQPRQTVPARLPQIAIAGRSNVGKSTLINRLVGRKKLARVSKRPGRTQEINFFQVDDRFVIADLPGYGFAKAPEEVRKRWGPLIEGYLSTADVIGIVFLIDIRRGLSDDDWRLLGYLEELGLPTLFVLTKVDKLNRNGRTRAVAKIREQFDADGDQLLETSALSGEGYTELWASLAGLAEAAE